MAKGKAERGLYKVGNSPNWYFDFSENGVRYQGSTGTPNKTLARKILTRKQSDVLKGEAGIRSGKCALLFSELVVRFLATRDPNKPSQKMYMITAETMKAFFGKQRVNQIDAETINRYVAARLAGTIEVNGVKREPVGRTTCNRDISFMRSVFIFGVENGYCNRNPIKRGMYDRKAEEAGKRIDEYLTVDEIIRYLDSCAVQYFPVAFCALTTGMRRGEVLNLKWCDVNLDQKTITLHKTKGGKQRTVAMPDKLTAVLRGVKCRQVNEFVFTNRNGAPYVDVRSAHRHTMIRSGLAAERERDGRTQLRFHDLRRSFASALAYQCKNPYMVSRALGHSTLEMTQSYVAMPEDQHREAIEAVSRQISENLRYTNVTVGDFGKKSAETEDQKEVVNKGSLDVLRP